MGFLSSLLKIAVIGAAVMTGVGLLTGAVAGGAAFGAYAAGTVSAYFASTFVTQLVLGAASYLLADKGAGANSITGTLASTRDPVAPTKIVYGRTRLGGTIVYLESTENNKYLHAVIALAGHEIDAVEKVYFGDDEVPLDGSGNASSGVYSGKARIQFKLGTDNQTAFADLVSESDGNWTNNHRLQGRAVAYVRLEYDQNVYTNGMPAMTFQVRGKKVYDPRSTQTVWSQNPALCLLDYMTSDRYGLGLDLSEVDLTVVSASANACDVTVPLSAGGTEVKYACNGWFDTSATPERIIQEMLTSMSGKATYVGGVWRILAGIYYTPTLTLDENDLRGGITMQTLVSRRENFNGVKGVFSSADDKYVPTDFPSILSSAFVEQDGGEEVYKSINLPFTTSPSMAQRLAKIELLKARQQITVTMPCKLNGLKANVGDIIYVNNERFGWSNKQFEVVGMGFALGEVLGVDLSLREISTDVFDWDASEEQAFDPAPNTTLPNVFAVGEVTNITANLNSYFDNNYGLVEWESDDALIDSYKVVIDGNVSSDLIPINENLSSRTIVVQGLNKIYINGQRYIKSLVTVNLTQEEYDQLKIGHYLIVHSYPAYGNRLVSEIGEIDTTNGTQITVLQKITRSSWTLPSFNGSSELSIYYNYTLDYPSKMFYSEYVTSEKKLGAIQFLVGIYKISVTPRNILGVYGNTKSVVVPIPEPPIPDRVSGLELDLGSVDGEANATEWTGRDVKIKWRTASFVLSYDINDYEAYGLDSGGLENYFKDYKVAVYNGNGELLREEFVTTTAYVYSYEKNAEDAAKYGEKAYRQLEFKVWARGKQNQFSELPAVL